MISSIEIRNWKTHENTRIEFSKGTNILVGRMGAGKSSTIDAICYGLFGTFPLVKQKKVKFSDIIKNRPKQEREASVKITFTSDSDTYTVERDIVLNGTGKARLSKNGAYMQSQPERVNEEIERVLKVDYDLFARAVYSEQNRLDYFLELKAKERKDQIDELLGLDKFALASDNVGSLINKVKDMIANQKNDAAQLDLESIKNQLSAFEMELQKLIEDRQKLLNELALVENSAKSLEGKMKGMKESEAKKTILAKEIAELRSKRDYALLEIKKIEVRNLGGIEKVEERIEEIEGRINDLRIEEKKRSELEREEHGKVAKIEAELYQIEKGISERDAIAKKISGRNVGKLELDYERSRKDLQDSETQLLSYISEMGTIEKALNELRGHMSKCPICEREITKDLYDRLTSERQKSISELKQRISNHEKGVEERRHATGLQLDSINELKVLNGKMDDYDGLDAMRIEHESAATNAKKALQDHKVKLEKLKTSIDKSNDELALFVRTRDDLTRKDGYMKDVSGFEVRIRTREDEFNSIEVDAHEIEAVQAEFVEVKKTEGRLHAENEAHTMYIDDKRMQIKDKQEQVGVVERMNRDIKQKEFAVQNLIKFRTSLDETKLVLRNKLVESINTIMQSMWFDMYPYGDYRSIMLNATPDDYMLSVLVSKDGEEVWEGVDAIASGGERSTASLALRVAFSLVLVPNLKWIILDEPTHNIDEDGIRRFIALFNERLPKMVEQIFIITHDELLKQSVNSNVYVLSRNKDESGSTVIERS